VVGCLAVYLGLYATCPSAFDPGADGFYGWLYARSAAFDGDLDFANDYKICGDPWRNGIDRGTGRMDNPFYPGPSLFWTPVLWTLKHLVPSRPGASLAERLGCRGRLTMLTLGLGPLLGAAAIALAYRAARRFVGDGEAAFAAALMAVGSSLPAYAAIMPSYSHVYATFATALFLWAATRVADRTAALGRWMAVAGALVLCVSQRLNFASMAIIPAVLAIRDHRREGRALAARLGLLAGAVALGALPTLLLYHHLYGNIFMLPQGRYYLQLGHGHPFLLLFSPNGGLLFATPAMWLPVLGIAPGWRRQRWLMSGVLLTAAAEIYVASCPITWDAGASYGARVLTPLAPLFVLPTAFLLSAARAWLVARPGRMPAALATALLVPLAFFGISAVSGLPSHRVPLIGATQEAAYGGPVSWGWSLIDAHIGDLSVLPAEMLFSLRYGLPRQSFRRATNARTFYRDYKSMAISNDIVSLSDPDVAPLLRGFEPGKGGSAISGSKGSLVFSAHWPHATRVTVAATSLRPQRLRVGLGRFWGAKWLGDILVADTISTPWPALVLPHGAFDSGLTEFVFACDPAPCHDAVVVKAIRLYDDNSYPPALR
jgi:hypothetical protein